jgi:hypothetical protein
MIKRNSLQFILAILLFSYVLIPTTPDKRVVDFLGKEKIEIIQKNNPDLIIYYNFFLDNAYIISEVPADKHSENNFQELVLPLKGGKVDKEKLNILKLDIQRKFDENVYYKIKNSKEVIVFLSEQEFMKKYNKHREELGLIK